MTNRIKLQGGEVILSTKSTSVINKAETVVISDEKMNWNLI